MEEKELSVKETSLWTSAVHHWCIINQLCRLSLPLWTIHMFSFHTLVMAGAGGYFCSAHSTIGKMWILYTMDFLSLLPVRAYTLNSTLFPSQAQIIGPSILFSLLLRALSILPSTPLSFFIFEKCKFTSTPLLMPAWVIPLYTESVHPENSCISRMQPIHSAHCCALLMAPFFGILSFSLCSFLEKCRSQTGVYLCDDDSLDMRYLAQQKTSNDNLTVHQSFLPPAMIL